MPRAPHIPPEDKGSSLALWVLILCLVGAALLVALCCPGCAPVRPVAVRPTTQPSLPLVVQWSHDWRADAAATHWRAECHRRFGDNYMALVVHGGDDGKAWFSRPDDGSPDCQVYAAAKGMTSARPGVPLVLICCNPGHYELKPPIPNVYYARRDVSVYPHRSKVWADSIYQLSN